MRYLGLFLLIFIVNDLALAKYVSYYSDSIPLEHCHNETASGDCHGGDEHEDAGTCCQQGFYLLSSDTTEYANISIDDLESFFPHLFRQSLRGFLLELLRPPIS